MHTATAPPTTPPAAAPVAPARPVRPVIRFDDDDIEVHVRAAPRRARAVVRVADDEAASDFSRVYTTSRRS